MILNNLRPYQRAAFDAVMEWVRKSVDPCLVDAATGSGKSWLVAALASELHRISGKHVLCLAPNADLVTQNREKYLTTGDPASVYSASAGGRCLRHPVVFATPGTFKKVARSMGAKFCAVVVDECHGITNTIKMIIELMQEGNPNLRVIGLSATPYRLGEGFIYQMDEDGNLNGDNCAKDPYFLKKVYTVPARLLIDQGYLSTPVIGEIGTEQYDTSGLVMNNSGKWQSASVDQAFVGHGRKTAAVVADVVRQSAGRKGVMLFAATVQHAEEIMASLPPGLSRMIGGKINTGKAERKRLVADFKAQRFKYLVSVQTMTTGVDFTHVDVVAILRATESVALLQQIIGRGLRVHEGKRDVLILDYAENLERHCPDGDIFSPEISANMTNGEKVIIDAECESCGAINKFSARKNPEGLQLDKHGYFMDLAGNRVETDHGPMPGHYGRRCKGMIKRGGTHTQCSQRWTFKPCPHCESENDIAAKYCAECRGELIDPNEKLRIEFKAMKRDPTQIQTDKVLSMDKKPVVTRTGKECVLVTFETEWRSFSVWLHPEAPRGRLHAEYLQFMDATQSGVEIPETVTYQKDSTSGFYRIYDYGRAADAIS
jgi:DNA repair protein RadD